MQIIILIIAILYCWILYLLTDGVFMLVKSVVPNKDWDGDDSPEWWVWPTIYITLALLITGFLLYRFIIYSNSI